MGQVQFTRHHVSVSGFAHRRRSSRRSAVQGSSPYQFVVKIKPIASHNFESQQPVEDSTDETIRLVLGASSTKAREQWVQACLNWNRTNWGDTQRIGIGEEMVLKQIIANYKIKPKLTKSIAASCAKRNISIQHTPVTQKNDAFMVSTGCKIAQDCVSFHSNAMGGESPHDDEAITSVSCCNATIPD